MATQSDKKQYDEMVKAASPASTVGVNCIKAFLVGGSICAIGQVFYNMFHNRGFAKEDAGLMVAGILIVTAIILTVLGLYNKLGKHAGAGSVVPITGFANAIAAPAIEYKKEGLVLGVGAKMFVIAGPVIVYGAMASVVVGLIYYFVK
ncbi:MAG: stage V sporulation protein AC [Defluviitaleaceae bacterium]|nr:stage V sporulation protein AC [Defluviitaleaceae bacterium]